MSTEPAPTFCAAHPRVETYLRCGRCDKPICARCLVQTPVGSRCRACAQVRRLPMYDVGPRFLLRGGAAAFGAATIGSVVLLFVPSFGLLLNLLLGAAYGAAVASAVSMATNAKRGSSLGWATIAALVLGFGVGRAALASIRLAGAPDALTRALTAGFSPDLSGLIIVGVAAAMAFSRLR